MSSSSSRLQGAIEQAATIHKNAVQRLLFAFLPNSKTISTTDEEDHLFQVLRETTGREFETLMKLFNGKEFSIDVGRQKPGSDGLPVLDRSDADSSHQEIPDRDSDDDMTVFEEGGQSVEEQNKQSTGLIEPISNDTDRYYVQHPVPDKNNEQMPKNTSQIHNCLDSNASTVQLPIVMDVDVDIHRVNSDTGVNSQESDFFQDTQTSVSDFRVINTNKKTNDPFDNNLKPAWKERVESYLNMIPPEGGIVPTSSIAESVISRFDDADDAISSISELIKTKTTSAKQDKYEENKENAATNVPENVQMRDSPKQAKQVGEKFSNSQTSESIEILFEKKRCPNSNASDGKESEMFHVDNSADDETMSCISESLLKTVGQSKANEGAVEQKHVVLTQQKQQILGTPINIDLTLDSDDENEDINGIVTHDNIISHGKKDGDLLNENNLNVNEIIESIDTILVDSQDTAVTGDTISRTNKLSNSNKDSELSTENALNVNEILESIDTILIDSQDTDVDDTISPNDNLVEKVIEDKTKTDSENLEDPTQGAIKETIGPDVTTSSEQKRSQEIHGKNPSENEVFSEDIQHEEKGENDSNSNQPNEIDIEGIVSDLAVDEEVNNRDIPNKYNREKSSFPKETAEQPTNNETSMEQNETIPINTSVSEMDPVKEDDCSITKGSSTVHPVSDIKYEQESLHIIDEFEDDTLNNSQELGSLDSEYSNENFILSQGGNFIYEVIPLMKVEVDIDDSNMDENLTFDDTEESSAQPAAKKKETNKTFKKPLPPKDRPTKKTQTNPIETTHQRKKCELGITSATRGIRFSDSSSSSDITSLSQKPVKKRPGPKSKTMHKPSSDGQPRTKHVETNGLSIQIKNLTNLNNLEKPKTSTNKKSKPKKRKRPSLLDFYDENENLSTISGENSLIEKIKSSVKTVNQIDAERLAREAILRSDSASEDGSVPPKKQLKRDLVASKENDGSTNNLTNRKTNPIPAWKKDPLLNGNINLSLSSNTINRNPSVSSTSGNKTTQNVHAKRKVNENDDDVQNVCSLMQEKVKDPNVKENLKKLLDAREVIVPAISEVISISSDEEEEDDPDSEDDTERDDDDLESVLNDDNKKELDTKFTFTSKKRSQRIRKRTRKFAPVTPQPSQEPVTFEDKYKDTPPLILDIDEETGEQISVCPFFSKILKDHQKRGVQFMWDVCFGNRKRILSDEGSGCILAHDMGLGKSVQIIALLHTLKRLDNIPITKILILSPKSLVQNWEDEVNKWTKGLQVRLKVFSWSTDKNIAVQNLHEWSGLGGIYILGYEMFVSVCKRFRSSEEEQCVDLTTFFLNPGPDVIVCDEAHLLKNSASEKYKMVSQVKTKRRIALTGTPIQNDLKELYNIVNFVQPTFMKPEKFRDQFIEPISLAQQAAASLYQKRKATERISVLHKELEKVMDREQGSNQEVGLPPKLNYDVFLYLTPIQKKLYKFFFDKLKDCHQDPKRNFEMGRKAEMIGIHPKSLELVLNKTRSQRKAEQKYEWPVELQGDWWDKVLTQDEKQSLNEIDAGVKIVIAFQILEYAARNKEKVLIFCNSHEVLNLMQVYLEQKGYKKNVNYFRLDCSVPLVNRRKYLKSFNNDDNTEAQVFLLTHKVGGVGLNFTGANRIVIFDMLWNPAYHEQSSNRTHRLGQKKTSFVYRLITKDSLEENIYRNSVSKQSLSKRVVDKKRIKSQCRETGIYNFIYRETPKLKKDLPYAKDDLLNDIIHNSDLNIVHSYREQGELFELSEEQLNEAQAYEEYLVESKTFELPAGESKRKRKRKSKGSEPENQVMPDSMMSREHIGNYDHGELLARINQPPAKPNSVQELPLNLSQTAGRTPPPPPLIRISRDGQQINQKLNRQQQQQKKETVAVQTLNQAHQPPQGDQLNNNPASSLPVYNKSAFTSISDFIQSQSNSRYQTDISGLASALANNAVEIIPRPSTSGTRIIDEISIRANDLTSRPIESVSRPNQNQRTSWSDKYASRPNETFHVNEHTSWPHESAIRPNENASQDNKLNSVCHETSTRTYEPQQPPALIQKRRLSINPDIFQRPPPVDNGHKVPVCQEQVHINQNQELFENGRYLTNTDSSRNLTPTNNVLGNFPTHANRTMSGEQLQQQQQQQQQQTLWTLTDGTFAEIRSDNIDTILNNGTLNECLSMWIQSMMSDRVTSGRRRSL